MRITKVYKNGDKEINEDAYIINEANKIYAVLDGATGLNGIPGYIASYAIQEELEQRQPSSTLLEIIQNGNEKLANHSVSYYKQWLGKIDSFEEIQKNQRSSTGIAAIQIDQSGKFFDYVHAGDCMLFLQYQHGEIRTVTYDLVQQLDQVAIKEVVRIRTENDNVDSNVLRDRVKPILLENRNKLNTSDGYGIIDGSNEAMEHLEYGRISMKRVKKILLLSDGLTMPVNNLDQDAWLLSARTAFDNGLQSLLEEVDKREAEDPSCKMYPRLKQRDDKTGILIEP